MNLRSRMCMLPQGTPRPTSSHHCEPVAMTLHQSYNSMVTWRLAPFFALLMSLAACGSQALTPTARDGFSMYVSVLRNPDPRPAYQMLSDEDQKRIPYQEWAAKWKEHEQERQSQAEELEASLKVHGVVDAKAILRFEDGKRVTLQKEASGWRLDQALVSQSVANSPRDALTIFSVALTEGKLAPLLRILSKRHRDGIAKKLELFHDSLRGELAKDNSDIFLVNEKRAELTWSAGELRYRLVLVLEDGDWYVDDIHLGPDPAYDEPAKTEESDSPALPQPE
ncbi:MAG: hypothetical protein JKY56_19035 [Kofleriaceae bacterium]|nr:hypothetical protein [Kofleriaceae bacterium]